MFHRWKLMCEAFPGSRVIVTRNSDSNRPWQYRPEAMDFPCVFVPETIRLSNHLAWSKGLVSIVKTAANKNVIHIIEDVSGANALNIIFTAKNNKFVINNDGGFVVATQRPTQKLRWHLVGKRCLWAMAPGEIGRKYLSAWGFDSNNIYNSYLSPDVELLAKFRDSPEAASIRLSIRKSLKVFDDECLVLCVSRLLDWKRIEDLVDAVSYLSSEAISRLHLVLIGDGPYKGPLENLQSKRNLRFKWIPSIHYDDVKNYYAASDFHILPSEGDIWGLVVNESLAMGKPVICTERIGASELVKDGWNGFKVPIRSPHHLAHAIQQLIEDDTLRDSMSINAMTILDTWNSRMFVREIQRALREQKAF
jgi:glycosyltransferase involved in cell wall biosynthesis